MASGDNFPVFGLNWFRIYFTENPGMAFGMELGGSFGKVALSLFRIIALGFIGYYLHGFIKRKLSYTLLTCVALIFAGALGNIIDSAFYGIIFSESTHYGPVATLLPPEGGYAPFLHGKVVDMLYFPLFSGTFPDWFPVWGGEDFMFFQAIFNIADSAISVGVVLVMLFYKRFIEEVSPSPAPKAEVEVLQGAPLSAEDEPKDEQDKSPDSGLQA